MPCVRFWRSDGDESVPRVREGDGMYTRVWEWRFLREATELAPEPAEGVHPRQKERG